MYTNHLEIKNTIKTKGKAKVASHNIDKFCIDFHTFTKLEVLYQKIKSNLYNVTFK